MDKLWTIYPVVASLLYAFFTPNPRVLAMTAAIVIWGLRLSYNFHRCVEMEVESLGPASLRCGDARCCWLDHV